MHTGPCLSSLVDLINHASDNPVATEPTIMGPFYVPDSPWREMGASIVEFDDGGEPTVVTGVVRDTEGAPIADAVLDVWHNAANGFYAVQQPEEQPATNLRGRFRTGDDGHYSFHTVRPVPYPIPNDGPVGRLLRDTGRHEWRAAHLHMKVTADGFTPLNTHIFDRESDYLESDTVFGVKGSLIADFTPGPDGVLVCETDIVLARSGV